MDNIVEASLIIGDSAIEIQEVDSGTDAQQSPRQIPQAQTPSGQASVISSPQQTEAQQPDIILGSHDPSVTLGTLSDSSGGTSILGNANQAGGEILVNQPSTPNMMPKRHQVQQLSSSLPSPVAGTGATSAREDITDGDRRSRPNHDVDMSDHSEADRVALGEVMPVPSGDNQSDGRPGKSITGKVVDFELTPAGGHNKAKIKKKKKKKKMEHEEQAYKKKWGKKKSEEKKAMEKKHQESMKKKKEEGKKGKKKWGVEEHGQKKKGKFKKKKWGKKFKKGKGVKKGKKGHKMLKDKGHKSTGFKTVYHKEEYGKSAKWHDIKREKKWDEKAKKWKKKWKKEKGKKYKGEHMKKFEKKKKEGKKYKKEKNDKFKKFKKEKYEKGKKMKKEEHGKKKEGGEKKEMKAMKKEKKKKKKKP